MDRGESELIDALYDAVTAPDRWPVAIELWRQYFQAQAAILGVYDPSGHGISLSVTSGAWTDAVMRQYHETYVRIDPALAKYAQVPAGKAVSTNQLFSSEFLGKNVFFNEFFGPLGLVECLGGRLLDVPGGFSAVAVHRDQKRKTFTPADIACVERLIPHVARAFQLHRTFARLDFKAHQLGTVVDRVTVGVVALGSDRQPLHVNKTLLDLAARNDGLQVDAEGALRAVDTIADNRLRTLVRSIQAGGDGGIVRIPRAHNNHHYAVMIAPLPPGTGFAGDIGQGRSGVLILVHDPDAVVPAPTTILISTFGLTARGAELTAALASGDDLQSYAERTSISLHTARFHLKAVFGRLGVRTQAQLVRAAIRALTDFTLAQE